MSMEFFLSKLRSSSLEQGSKKVAESLTLVIEIIELNTLSKEKEIDSGQP